MDDIARWWKTLSEDAKSLTILIVVGTLVVGSYLIMNANDNKKGTPTTTPPSTKSVAPNPTYTANDVLGSINVIRASKGLTALSQNTSLNYAAQARSDEMARQGIRDNSSGDTAVLISNAGYSQNGWSLQSTWGENTANDAAVSITDNEAFALGTDYQDIGVGVSTYDGGRQKLVAIFLANPEPVQTHVSYQTYWYCWDYGDPAPHHLGHHVYGDHYCSYQELHDAGFAGY